MIRVVAIVTLMFVAAAIPARAQGGSPPSAPQGAQPATVIGQTGTMYDGNNADLKMPSERHAYWVQLWAEPGGSGIAGAGSAVGTGTADTSRGGAQTGGQH
jgi:hypothetical protein